MPIPDCSSPQAIASYVPYRLDIIIDAYQTLTGSCACAGWNRRAPHSVENIDLHRYHAIRVEFK